MPKNDLITTTEASEYLRVAVQTLKHWRVQKLGPPYIKVGGRVYYRQTDIESWLEERRTTAA